MKRLLVFISLLFCSSFAFSVGFNVGNPGVEVGNSLLKSYVVSISFIPSAYPGRSSSYDLSRAQNLCMGTLTVDGQYVITSAKCVDSKRIPEQFSDIKEIKKHLFVSFYKIPEASCKFWGGRCYGSDLTYSEIKRQQRMMSENSLNPEDDLQSPTYQTLSVTKVENYNPDTQGVVKLRLSRIPDFIQQQQAFIYPFNFQSRRDTLHLFDLREQNRLNTINDTNPIPSIGTFENSLEFYGTGSGNWIPFDDFFAYNVSNDNGDAFKLLQNAPSPNYYIPMTINDLEERRVSTIIDRHFIRFNLSSSSVDYGDIGAPVILKDSHGRMTLIGIVARGGILGHVSPSELRNHVVMDVALLSW